MRALSLTLALGILVSTLTACGGGGGGGSPGGTVYVNMSYPAATVSLFSDATVTPAFYGFENLSPGCAVTGGSLPAGMSVRNNCTLAGRPGETGSFYVNVRLSASGAANTVDTGGSVNVVGPGMFYPLRSISLSTNVGDTVNDVPYDANWTRPAGVALNWTFSLKTGALPPGLSLDPATGAVSGIAAAQGSFYATIAVRLDTIYGSYELTPANYQLDVGVPRLGYTNTGGTGVDSFGTYEVAWVSQPFQATPQSNGGAVGSTLANFAMVAPDTLPDGLTLDPVTGVISGIATGADTTGERLDVQAVVTSSGYSNPIQGVIALRVAHPVYVFYDTATVTPTVGVAFSILPTKSVGSPLPLISPSYGYALQTSFCNMPPGVSVDPTTGALGGTPTAAGNFSCSADVTITNNGMTWVQGAYFSLTVR